jgi:hypothetical protein
LARGAVLKIHVALWVVAGLLLGRAQADEDKREMTLPREQLDKLGVKTQPAEVRVYRSESIGYGTVLDHLSIAQSVADLQTAAASAQFSKAALERARRLHDSPGAMSADLEQTAAQKAAVDTAALTLTTEKLSATWGMQPPWKADARDPRVQALAHGSLQLIRVTFPLGAIQQSAPSELHGGAVGGTRTEAALTMKPVWGAPADASMPGRSFFTIAPAGTVAEGDRLEVWAPTGQPTQGAVVPMAAVVLSGGKFWCYVEKTAGTLVRVEVNTSRPVSGGYVVTVGVQPGDQVVVTAASQLLAKELGSSEAD